MQRGALHLNTGGRDLAAALRSSLFTIDVDGERSIRDQDPPHKLAADALQKARIKFLNAAVSIMLVADSQIGFGPISCFAPGYGEVREMESGLSGVIVPAVTLSKSQTHLLTTIGKKAVVEAMGDPSLRTAISRLAFGRPSIPAKDTARSGWVMASWARSLGSVSTMVAQKRSTALTGSAEDSRVLRRRGRCRRP